MKPWTEAERAVLRVNYARHGAAHCKRLLPGRSIGSIYQEASLLGITERSGQKREDARCSITLRNDGLCCSILKIKGRAIYQPPEAA